MSARATGRIATCKPTAGAHRHSSAAMQRLHQQHRQQHDLTTGMLAMQMPLVHAAQ
jgi:hypothetical protein